MDNLVDILEHTLAHRHNIWMFYTIIITTVFGIAFTDSYKALNLLPRIILSVAVGAAVWYNFYAIVINTMFIHEIVTQIRELVDPSDPLYNVFHSPIPSRYNPPDVVMINNIYFFVNFALFFAMWWDECVLFGNWIKKKIDRMPD